MNTFEIGKFESKTNWVSDPGLLCHVVLLVLRKTLFVPYVIYHAHIETVDVGLWTVEL